MPFYYLCKRCDHMAKQKIEMKRHLGKNKKCKIKDVNNKYSDIELYQKSLVKVIVNCVNENSKEYEDDKEEDELNKNIIMENIENNIKINCCSVCNKQFHNISNLKKHQRNVCFKNVQNMNIQNNNTINNNQKIINININCLKGFDEEWDVSKIDNLKKSEILLSNSKFTKTLENILDNNVNLNVILNNDETGIVYKNDKNKYEPMQKKEIIEMSMNKIYKHLRDFYDEIMKNNINDTSLISLKTELVQLEKKYNDFFALDDAKNFVKKLFTDIYDNKKDEAENEYSKLLGNNYIGNSY